jgi:valyl-tRNA synthetase
MPENIQLEPVYDPRTVEPEIYARWESAGAFVSTPDGRPHGETYCIVIPPPNVTGALHLGHALNNTLQDILVRYHRMRGFNTLWQPGTDHAGIATQAVVERRIRETEGKTRHQIGREELVRRIWTWKDEYERRIISQLKLMGCSCDWSRTRFTLDDGLARAVRKLFFDLFRDGLIFRGKRLVNWDTELQTAVSNDEMYHEEIDGNFWHIRYPVIQPKGGEPAHVVIATTRPETMLGDVAVAVNPDPQKVFDEREAALVEELRTAGDKDRADVERRLEQLRERRTSHLGGLTKLRDMARAGRKLLLPLVDREIPLIADEWADPTLGSGCVKITPAHDPNDYEVGRRHGLPMINVLTPDGRVAAIIETDSVVNPKSNRYEGLAFNTEGRRRVVEDLDILGLLEQVEAKKIDLGFSDRSKTPIEPFLSDQWFVRMDDVAPDGILMGNGKRSAGLAQAAMDAVQGGAVEFFPPRYAKSYLDWLGEKRDWCISRQLWWGHQIPIWRSTFRAGADTAAADARVAELIDRNLAAAQRVQVGESAYEMVYCLSPEVSEADVKLLEGGGFVQDPDVLDTWFSSQLWPFSTLGWPDHTEHLKQYYPGSVLVTSRDIITLWVARMVLSGLYALGEVPFDRVYITPKVLDGRGDTMSKSKGNGVDPLDIIHVYGADALRYSMADMTTESQDIRMPVEYLCPHCGKLTDQGAALKKEEQTRKSRGEKLNRKIMPFDCHVVQCGHKECGKTFATQWASDEVKSQHAPARETSEKFEIGRNFCNKLWNAARFAFMNLEGATCEKLDVAALAPEDRWILSQLSQTVRTFHEQMGCYQYSAAVKTLREYFWDSLCDWYIELTKPRLADPDAGPSARAARQVLAFVLDQVLRLWHPMIPFITERLWAQLGALVPRRGLPGVAEPRCDTALILAPFPPAEGYPALDAPQLDKVFGEIQDVVRGVRDLRSQCGVSPKQAVRATVAMPEADRDSFEASAHIVLRMANLAQLSVEPGARRPANAGSIAVRGLRIYVHDISDDAAERTRATTALAEVNKQIEGKERKLSNDSFVRNANPEVVAAERARLSEMLAQRQALEAHLAEL